MPWRSLVPLLLASVISCSLIVDNKLEGKDPQDAGVADKGPVRLDATTKAPRIEAAIAWPNGDPIIAGDPLSIADLFKLKVTIFNFKLAKNVQEPAPEEGFYLITFVQAGAREALFKSSARERSLRLEEFPQLFERPLASGNSALEVSLHHGDGRPVEEAKVVELPFHLCIPGLPDDRCGGVVEPPPGPGVPECKPQDGCEPCKIPDLLPPEMACPACLHATCNSAAPCVQLELVEPTIIGPKNTFEVAFAVHNFKLVQGNPSGSGPGEPVGRVRMMAMWSDNGTTMSVPLLDTHETEVTVSLTSQVPPAPATLLVSAMLVNTSGKPLEPVVRACWPIIRVP